MQLIEFLSEDAVCENLKSNERDEALHEMLDALVAAGELPEEDVEPVLRAIVKREALGTTAIGRRMAVPHARVDDIERTIMAVGLSRQGVGFHALDGQPVRAIFLVIGSNDRPEEYIETLRKVSNMVQSEDFRRFLLRAAGVAEVMELIDEMQDES